MGRGFIATVFCLLLLSGKAFAGWYQVENYEGSIGPNPVHLSLQRYASFGSGITVEGSYFYDARQSPIAIYGKADGQRLTLCEIADDKEFERVLVRGSKSPVDTTGCPFSLELGEDAATGNWSKGADKYPVTLKKVASLDDTGDLKLGGTVEIPFWAETATDRFAGIYTKSDAGICMTGLRVINKRKSKAVQEIGFDDPDCNAGMLMTPIYMNVQKWVEGGKDIIAVNFRGGGAGHTEDYAFSPKAKKYRKRK
ncbi:hypothetical protein [Mesorhizobium sp. B4-1-1]|uniref:hypothetical protein n=1 Tax=Mesorhizobium sp. B4-1-1 TaxID=2589890 RepID=UPI001125B7F0|nr:hypothetical protein [Mesorhizobium sp. B4-1-1]TPI20215.1 hypothetical protein FJW10_12850 [Mesorhizobium sp. B4-1-1]